MRVHVGGCRGVAKVSSVPAIPASQGSPGSPGYPGLLVWGQAQSQSGSGTPLFKPASKQTLWDRQAGNMVQWKKGPWFEIQQSH